MPSDINDLLSSLQDSVENSAPPQPDNINESRNNSVTDVHEFLENPYDALIKELVSNIKVNKKVLDEAKKLAQMTDDPGFLESFSSVSKANSENLKILSLALTERDKLRSVEKIKEKEMQLKKEIAVMQIESKERIAEGKQKEGPKQLVQNNFTLVANRDKMFDLLFSDDPEQKAKLLKEVMGQEEDTQEAEIIENP